MTFWETLDFPVCGEVGYGLSISLLDFSNWNDDYIATLSDHDQLGVRLYFLENDLSHTSQMYILTADVSLCMVRWNLLRLSSALFLVITKVEHVSRIVIRCAATLTPHVHRLTSLLPRPHFIVSLSTNQSRAITTSWDESLSIFRSREFQWLNKCLIDVDVIIFLPKKYQLLFSMIERQ